MESSGIREKESSTPAGIFGPAYAALYDNAYSTKDYHRECDEILWAVERFGSSDSHTALDLGCGTGEHAVELVRRGWQVTGVDQSSDMIERAESKRVTESNPTFMVGSIGHSPVEGTFDVVMMMFAVLGYLTTTADLLDGLSDVSRHLRPGGLFMADFWYGPGLLADPPVMRTRSIPTEVGMMYRKATPSLDMSRNLCDIRYDLAWTNNGVEMLSEETHRLRYFFTPELELALRVNKLELLQVSDVEDWKRPLDERAWNAALVARRV